MTVLPATAPRSFLDRESDSKRAGSGVSRVFADMEIIRTEAELLSLQPWWDSLLEQSGLRSPFLRWDWVLQWWEEQKTIYELAVVVLRNALGEPRAIAPWVIGPDKCAGRRHLKHLAFLGGIGEICGERLDLLVPRGEEAFSTPLLCESLGALRPCWHAIRLNALPEDSPNLPYLKQALRQWGVGARVLNRYESRFIRLPSTWEELESRQSANRRSQIRRKWKALTQTHGARTLLAGRDCPAQVALDALTTLHSDRYEKGVSQFLRGAIQRFHQRLAPRWLAEGRAMMPYLEIEGKPAGVLYGLVEGDAFFYYQLGWEQRFSPISLGTLTMAWSMRCAIDRGLKHYDMLPGDFDYKTRWCDEASYLLDLEAYHPACARSLLFRALRFAKRWVSGPATPSKQSHQEVESHP